MFIHNWTCWNWLDRYSVCVSRWMNTFRKKRENAQNNDNFISWTFEFIMSCIIPWLIETFFKNIPLINHGLTSYFQMLFIEAAILIFYVLFLILYEFYFTYVNAISKHFFTDIIGAFKTNIRDTYFWMNQSCVTKKVVAQDFRIMFFFHMMNSFKLAWFELWHC